MKKNLLGLILQLSWVALLSMVRCHAQQVTVPKAEPSLEDTFEWMTNTLKLNEGNNIVIHRPFERPYSKNWVQKRIDPYHSEAVSKFSHDGCNVEFVVDVTDHDMGTTLGRVFYEREVDAFDLTNIDPTSVRTEEACATFDTPSGPTKPWNCEDEEGKFVGFKTSGAKAKIHGELSGSSARSWYGLTDPRESRSLDDLCKDMPGNIAYCDLPEHKEDAKDMTSLMFGFSTPEYAQRFAKAFRHAVELCGGRPSAF